MHSLAASRIHAVVACFALAVTASAQHNPTPERAFRDAVVQKQLYLQNFSAEEDVKAVWDGSVLRLPRGKTLALAAFITSSAEIASTHVRLHGVLQLVMQDADNPRRFLLDASRMPTTITIDLHGPNASATLLPMRDLLFFKDINEALRSVPPTVRKFVPPSNIEKKAKLLARTQPCDCADTTPACKGETQELNSAGWKGPVAVSSIDDVIIGSASDQTLKFAIEIESNGKVSGVWTLRYAEATVARTFSRTLASDLFKAATCHDMPTATVIEIKADLLSN